MHISINVYRNVLYIEIYTKYNTHIILYQLTKCMLSKSWTPCCKSMKWIEVFGNYGSLVFLHTHTQKNYNCKIMFILSHRFVRIMLKARRTKSFQNNLLACRNFAHTPFVVFLIQVQTAKHHVYSTTCSSLLHIFHFPSNISIGGTSNPACGKQLRTRPLTSDYREQPVIGVHAVIGIHIFIFLVFKYTNTKSCLFFLFHERYYKYHASLYIIMQYRDLFVFLQLEILQE